MYSAIIEKKDKYCKEIETKSLMALCEMENYDIFCKELESLIASKRNKDLIRKMYRIMQGKFVLGKRKYKNFVKKYQDIIEIMKKHHCLCDMTFVKYNPNGTPNKNSTEDYFYKYILEHKEDIETIKNVVKKIKDLGFYKIIYWEKLDFTLEEYNFNYGSYGSDFKYLENIEIIPSYNKNSITYKTKNSCYCIDARIGYDKEIRDYSKEIRLNTLIFDSNRLPNEITFESTIGTIIKSADSIKDDYQNIKDFIDMSIIVDNLKLQYNNIKNRIESIESIKNKKEIIEILKNILKEINDLKIQSSIFETEVINSSERIDEELIEKEKKLYLKRRIWENLDIH